MPRRRKNQAEKAAKSAKSAPGGATPTRRGGYPRLTTEEEAQIWVLRDAGSTLREIGEAIGCSPSRVHATLMADPTRLEKLIAFQRQAHADGFKQIVGRGQAMLLEMMTRAGSILAIGPQVDGEAKKTRTTPSKADDYFIQHGRPWAAVIRLAVEGSANKVQLLTGQPTERTDSTVVVSEQTPEEAIRFAHSEGIEDSLPPALLPRYRRMLKAGLLGGKPKPEPEADE